MAKNRKSPQKLHSKVATVIVEISECRELAIESAEEMKVTKNDVVLQSSLQDSEWEEMDAQSLKVAEHK